MKPEISDMYPEPPLVTPSRADKLLKEFDNRLLVESEKEITDYLETTTI
jgi:hypothetical protein